MRIQRMQFAGLLGAVLLLTACAAGPTPGFLMAGAPAYPPPELGHRTATPHLELYWGCTRETPDVLRVEGVARNFGQSQPVRSLEFTLLGLDREERVTTAVHATAQSVLLRDNEVTPFRLALRPTGREARVDLEYRYLFEEMDLDARLAAAAPVPLRLARNQGSIIRDACNESLHRAR
jgi:hypothetical protein